MLRSHWAYQNVNRVVECNSDSSSIIIMITPFILIKLCCIQVLGSCMYVCKRETGVCGTTTMQVIFITFVLLNISLLVLFVKFGFLILLMGDYTSCMQSRIYHQK